MRVNGERSITRGRHIAHSLGTSSVRHPEKYSAKRRSDGDSSHARYSHLPLTSSFLAKPLSPSCSVRSRTREPRPVSANRRCPQHGWCACDKWRFRQRCEKPAGVVNELDDLPPRDAAIGERMKETERSKEKKWKKK